MHRDCFVGGGSGRPVSGGGAAIVAPAVTGTLNINALPTDVVVGQLRPGLYAVARGAELLGRVRGDYACGFEALLPDGRRVGYVAGELLVAVEALLVEGSWSA